MWFLILIIFIITAPIVQKNIKIDLPQGRSKEIGDQEELVVTINKHGDLFFNAIPVEENNLIKTVQASCKDKTDIPIYIRADRSINYGKVITIVDRLKQAKMKHVAMAMQEKG